MKDNSSILLRMAMGCKTSPMEMSIEDTTCRGSPTGLENTIGPMEPPTKGSSWVVFGKEKEPGSANQEINMLVILVVIAKMDTENISGLMAIYIRETFVKIWEKAMERWLGMMEAPIMGSGRGVCPTVKVHMDLIKLGTFKVKGEKPRTGYF